MILLLPLPLAGQRPWAGRRLRSGVVGLRAEADGGFARPMRNDWVEGILFCIIIGVGLVVVAMVVGVGRGVATDFVPIYYYVG